MKKEYTLIISKERLVESLIKDLFTFGLMAFCIWFSSGSKVWTFICVCMFLLYTGGMAAKHFSSTVQKFSSKEEAIEFLEKEIS